MTLHNEQRLMAAVNQVISKAETIRTSIQSATTVPEVQHVLRATYDMKPSLDVLVEALMDAKDRADQD